MPGQLGLGGWGRKMGATKWGVDQDNNQQQNWVVAGHPQPAFRRHADQEKKKRSLRREESVRQKNQTAKGTV